jgi:hypothetical protein
MARAAKTFDPLTVIAALERTSVDYVLIGGLAQVLRGADVVTSGVDICPSFARGNLDRLAHALSELTAGERSLEVSEETLSTQPIVRVSTDAGKLGIVASPAGVPNGFVDLRRAATREDLGHGLRPLVASTADLAAMAAALQRPEDLERLPMLRRIVELEASPGQERTPGLTPGAAARRRVARRGPRLST